MASSLACNGEMNGTKRRKKTRLDKNAHVVIIGSGLGGLGAAISLRQAGFTNVDIYERDESALARREGYGLTLSYNPRGPLAQMGLLEEVAQRDCPSRSHYIFSPDGSILGYYGNAFSPNRGKGQRGNLRVPRQVLRKIMLDRVHPSNLHWGKQLVSFQQASNYKLQLTFQDGTIVDNVDLLVGADGIRSSVLKTLVGNDTGGLCYLGIMIILGIADFLHPHLNERGFYTLDGTHRLFTMPYEGSKLDDEQGGRTNRRIMWQLSFRLENGAEAQQLSAAGPTVLKSEVLRRCNGWHEPVTEMVKTTPLETIWGTGLMDRNPQELFQSVNSRFSSSLPPRVVVLGDAVHPMSPFKGQGANQALLDGPLLASWLQSASIHSAVKSFWREMVQRTAKVVKASREAATMLHSPTCLEGIQDFAGVRPECVKDLLVALKTRRVGAASRSDLDNLVRETIHNLGYEKQETLDSEVMTSAEYKQLCNEALELSAAGDVMGLRNLSLTSGQAIYDARNELDRSCLHLAVIGGHYDACRWLVTEVGMSPDECDEWGSTAMHYALVNGYSNIRQLFIEERRSRTR